GDIYWGAAHGLAGIMYVLMHFGLPPDAFADVNKTLKYMINNRFPSGNYPRDEAKRSDELVYWCHGAPGVALTQTKAAEANRAHKLISEGQMHGGDTPYSLFEGIGEDDTRDLNARLIKSFLSLKSDITCNTYKNIVRTQRSIFLYCAPNVEYLKALRHGLANRVPSETL
nr:LanC-like protein GCL2 [Tanacetum cinerariifolium]